MDEGGKEGETVMGLGVGGRGGEEEGGWGEDGGWGMGGEGEV